MTKIQLSRWGQAGVLRGTYDTDTGMIINELHGKWELSDNGVFFPGRDSVGSLYWEADKLQWQSGTHRFAISDCTEAIVHKRGRRLWQMSLSTPTKHCEWYYECLSVEDLARLDPTYHVDDYEDENLGILVINLTRDSRRRARFLRPLKD
ncbi:MAG: hypothetical protein ACKVW3_17015 [Phycisphaerales bacterium]